MQLHYNGMQLPLHQWFVQILNAVPNKMSYGTVKLGRTQNFRKIIISYP